jgi:hypothetical protein
LPEIGINSFNNYFSDFNSLRVGKGFFWALAYLPFLATVSGDGRSRLAFMRGVAIGAAIFALWVVIERQFFSGIFNLSNDFRVTGAMSTMHTGGGHIEALLVMLFPLVIYWVIKEPRSNGQFLGIILLAVLAYSLLVTYARGGYAAFIGSMLLMALPYLSESVRRRTIGYSWIPIGFLLVGLGMFALLLAQSSYVEQRMETVSGDKDIRVSHWRDSLAMMDRDLATTLFGMGLGRYPVTYALRNPSDITLSSYRFAGPEEDPYLELGAGETLYFEQIIDLKPNTVYRLSIDIRSGVQKGRLSASICEKAMLYSFKCKGIPLRFGSGGEGWQTLTHSFNSGEIGDGNLWNARPVKLSLSNRRAGPIVAIDNVSVVDLTGNEIVSNGNFSRFGDYWYFATDNHLPWHIKQLGVQLYFSQGLFGLSVFVVFVLLALKNLLRSAVQGDAFSGALASSIVGFLIVGLVASLFDAPRLTFLFFSLLFIATSIADDRETKKSAPNTIP